MKSIKWFIGALLVFFGLAVAAGYLLPERTRFEHATYIKVAPETVYGLLSDLGEFKNWSPWHAADEKIQYRVGPPQRGLNATLDWNSDHSVIGSGQLTIIDAQPDNKLRMLMDFENGEQAILGFQLESLESGTHITWAYQMDHGTNPFSRYSGLLHRHRIKTIYEPSLDRLRRLAESRPPIPETSVVTEVFDYEVNGTVFKGYLAYDKSRQWSPGVLIVHEWWGQTDFVRKRAEQLAGLGYVAFALDLYGDGKQAGHPDEAAELSKQVNENFDAATQHFNAALDVLKNHPAVNPEHLAAIGYSFGGSIVLNMARAGIDLDGVVSFYGVLEPANGKAKRGLIKSAMLVLNGVDDPLVSPEQRQAFRDEMDAAGIDYEFIDYPGAKHAFSNPTADEYAEKFGLPLAYDPNADQQSWQQMRNFFDRIFR